MPRRSRPAPTSRPRSRAVSAMRSTRASPSWTTTCGSRGASGARWSASSPRRSRKGGLDIVVRMTARPLALITGASGGLGYEFARLLAERGHDLVVVARSGAPMEELAQWAEARHGVEVTVLPKDLSHPGAGGEVAEELAERDLHPDVLINNAGFTQLAPFTESDERVMLSLLRVNIETLTQLTRRIAPGMVARGHGRIVNLASNAAFQPGPYMACYYASKAYV